jgi:type I restriction enzyme S subunit
MSEFAELRVGDHVGFLSGFPFGSEYFNGEKGVRLIRIRDLLGGDDNVIYFSGPFDHKWLIVEGDVLIGMDGDFNIVRWKSEPALLNQRILKVEGRQNSRITHDYFYYWCAPRLLEIHARTAATTVKHLSVRDLERAVGDFPPVDEQRRIATILTTLDEVIEATGKLVEKHQQIKSGLMHDLFTRGLWTQAELARGDHKGLPCAATAKVGQLRPTPDEAPRLYKNSPLGRIPKTWEMKKCIDLCETITVGIVVRPTQYYVTEGVPALRSANIRETGIEMSDLVFITELSNAFLFKSKIKQGDVLSVRTGYPGTSAVVPPELDGCNCIDILLSRPTEEIQSQFLSNWINSSFGRGQVLSKQGGLAQQHFNVGELRNLLVAVPSAAEQTAITARLTSVSDRISTEEAHIANLRQQKQGLMHDLLTGRVRVDTAPSKKS